MKKISENLRLRYIRWLISHPRYYRNRAIEMGELFGIWSAEERIALHNSIATKRYENFEYCHSKVVIYLRRMNYYAQKASELKLKTFYDEI